MSDVYPERTDRVAMNAIGRPASKRLISPVLISCTLLSFPVLVWRGLGRVPPLAFAGYLAVAVAGGVTLYLLRPRGDRLPADASRSSCSASASSALPPCAIRSACCSR